VWLILTFFGGSIVSALANVLAPYGSSGTAAQQVSNANMTTTLFGLLPNGMFGQITAVLLNPDLNSLNPIAADPTGRAIAALLPFQQSVLIVWPQIVLMVALTAVCFGLAYVTFMRQEVRA